MKSFVYIFMLVALSSFSACTSPEPAKTSPESAGISSEAIAGFVKALDNELPDQIHSFMLLRHGEVLASSWWEPYNAETPHMLYSLSKSFTSTAVGIAQDEGLLSIDDPVISFFPDKIPDDPGDNLKAMRIRDLLKMSSGHQRGTSGGMMSENYDSWVEGFLSQEVQHKPGTHFVYNSGATYILSAIVQKVSGLTVLDYLTPRLFEPLGISNPAWESCPDGINTGGWGLSVCTEDISRLGQLYLQKGMWNGKRLISEEWIVEATKLQSSNGSNPESDWDQGYGYQFWMCRNNLYRGDGAFGQFCIVMPEQDVVLAITSGTPDMQAVMNLVWKHLLPAFEAEPLPANEVAVQKLNDLLQNRAISYAKGEAESALASTLSGKIFSLESNELGMESISFEFDGSNSEITFNSGNGNQSFKAAYGAWEKGQFASPGWISDEVSVSAAWNSDDQYLLKMVYHETPYIVKLTFSFEEDVLLWDTELNVSFGPTQLEQLKGKMSAS